MQLEESIFMLIDNFTQPMSSARVRHCHGARRRPSARSDNRVGPESAASCVQRVRNILLLVASAQACPTIT